MVMYFSGARGALRELAQSSYVHAPFHLQVSA